VSQFASRENALWGLLHDAAEAYIGDIPSPIKTELRYYNQPMSAIENAILHLVAEKIGLEMPIPSEIKTIDLKMLATEGMQIMPNSSVSWDTVEEPFPLPLNDNGNTPEFWEQIFLDRFKELSPKEAQ